MGRPAITVIICSYNAGDYLQASVASVLAKALTNYELLLIEELAGSGLLQQIDVIMMEWHYHGPDRLITQLTNSGFHVFNRNIPNDGGLRGLIYVSSVSSH